MYFSRCRPLSAPSPLPPFLGSLLRWIGIESNSLMGLRARVRATRVSRTGFKGERWRSSKSRVEARFAGRRAPPLRAGEIPPSVLVVAEIQSVPIALSRGPTPPTLTPPPTPSVLLPSWTWSWFRSNGRIAPSNIMQNGESARGSMPHPPSGTGATSGFGRSFMTSPRAQIRTRERERERERGGGGKVFLVTPLEFISSARSGCSAANLIEQWIAPPARCRRYALDKESDHPTNPVARFRSREAGWRVARQMNERGDLIPLLMQPAGGWGESRGRGGGGGGGGGFPPAAVIYHGLNATLLTPPQN